MIIIVERSFNNLIIDLKRRRYYAYATLSDAMNLLLPKNCMELTDDILMYSINNSDCIHLISEQTKLYSEEFKFRYPEIFL